MYERKAERDARDGERGGGGSKRMIIYSKQNNALAMCKQNTESLLSMNNIEFCLTTAKKIPVK